MILLALAAQLGAPAPTKPLFTPDDVPVGLIRENVLHTVGVAVTIKPDGKVQDCQAERSSGNRKLDSHTCDLLSRRARFRPPVQPDGSPGYGVYRSDIDWWVGEGHPPSRPVRGDLYIRVSGLPAKVESPTLVRLAIAVDASGFISSCAAEEPKYNATLTRLGCEQLLKTYKPTPAKTLEGVPVSSVQTATVVFEDH